MAFAFRICFFDMQSFFDDVTELIDFGEAEADALRELLPIAEPHFERITGDFYRDLTAHPGALAALRDTSRIPALRATLERWLRSGLQGPWDESFLRARWRIGLRHVALGIPQHFMMTSMNRIRREYHALIGHDLVGDATARLRLHTAIDKLLDVELAIVLQSYLEDSQDRLARRERLASIGRLAGNVAHELRNPLGVIASSAYLMKRQGLVDDHGATHLDRIEEHVARCTAIVHNLLELARNREPQRETLKVSAVVATALSGVVIPANVRIEQTIADDLEMRGDSALLSHAVANLVLNAIAAHGSNHGTVTLAARHDAEGATAIEVADDGPGFPASLLQNAFEELVTSRGDGVGLGLALVRSIAQLHGGSVEASNAAAGGALLRMTIPTYFEEAR